MLRIVLSGLEKCDSPGLWTGAILLCLCLLKKV